ncbi:MAG: thioesterase [Desulfobacterales bacterium]|nr:thioesterase [Desulfobacterales bacterium]
MSIQTHQCIDQRLCGRSIELIKDQSRIEFVAQPDMAADETGLVHGGFIFGLADYAAMLAVNHPNVVLGSAQVKFIQPVRVGDALISEATVTQASGKKKTVHVIVKKEDQLVFEGELICFTLEKHVLSQA